MDIFKLLTQMNDLSVMNERVDVDLISKLIEHYKIKNIRRKRSRQVKMDEAPREAQGF